MTRDLREIPFPFPSPSPLDLLCSSPPKKRHMGSAIHTDKARQECGDQGRGWASEVCLVLGTRGVVCWQGVAAVTRLLACANLWALTAQFRLLRPDGGFVGARWGRVSKLTLTSETRL